MAVYEIPRPAPAAEFWTEAKAAMNDALKRPGVLITVILCGTVIILSVVGGLIWLALQQRDASYIMALVNTLLTALLYKQVHNINGKVVSIEKQTNGTTSRLLDATLGPKETT